MPPLIEILPHTSTTSTAPGWAYVLDTGPPNDLSKSSVLPTTGPRHRNTRNPNSNTGAQETTARQSKRLAELERDGVQGGIQIPAGGRGREVGRITKTKLTPNVRRILLSQKTFANHLADEEAFLTNQSSTTTATAAAAGSSSAANRPPRTTVTATPSATTPSTAASKKRPPSKSTTKPPPPTKAVATTTPTTTAAKTPLPSPPLHPLLTSDTPAPPSPTTISSLLSQPPLPYTAARAAPASLNNAPPRHFCEICGYWGRVRCLKCGARVCGLECKGVHDEGRCLRFYA